MIGNLFVKLAWPCNFALVLLLLFDIWRHRHIIAPYIIRSRYVALSALALTAIVSISVNHELRILSDETNILSTSQSMLFRHSALNWLSAQFPYGLFEPITWITPKRPTMFAFLMSLWHTVFGFSAVAGIWINHITLFLLIYLMGWIAFGRFGLIGALGMQLLTVSQPLLSFNATSGGFDLFAAVLLVFTLFITHMFMTIRSVSVFKVLLILSAILTWSRYESGIYAAFICGLLCLFKYISMTEIKKCWKLILSLFVLCIPTLFQKYVSVGMYEQGDNVPLFGFRHFMDNAPIFVNNVWVYDGRQPFNFLVNVFGIIFLLCVFSRSLTRRLRNRNNVTSDFMLIASSLTIFNVIMMLFHCDAEITNPTQARYFMIMAIVSTALVYPLWFWRKWNAGSLFCVGLVSFFLFHPIAIEDKFNANLTLTREFRYVMAFIKDRTTQDTMIITERPGLLVSQRIPAISFEFALEPGKRGQIEHALRNRAFDRVLVFQHFNYKDEIDNKNDLTNWNLKEIMRFHIDHEQYLRVSEMALE